MDMPTSGSTPVFNNPQSSMRFPGERIVSYPMNKANQPDGAAVQAQPAARDDQMSREDIAEITENLNDFMKMLNTDIKFTLHEETHRLMVQVVDIRKNEVIKEFPPRELLDTLAAISDHIGMLLDKRV